MCQLGRNSGARPERGAIAAHEGGRPAEQRLQSGLICLRAAGEHEEAFSESFDLHTAGGRVGGEHSRWWPARDAVFDGDLNHILGITQANHKRLRDRCGFDAEGVLRVEKMRVGGKFTAQADPMGRAGVGQQSVATSNFEFRAEARLLRQHCQGGGNFVSLGVRRRADIQDVKAHGRLFLLLGRRKGREQDQDDRGNPNEEHGRILNQLCGTAHGRAGEQDSGTGVGCRISGMANLMLVYGMRLLPAEEVEAVGEATIQLKSGRQARVTMHVLEGSKSQIERQLMTSIEAFFEMYPEL